MPFNLNDLTEEDAERLLHALINYHQDCADGHDNTRHHSSVRKRFGSEMMATTGLINRIELAQVSAMHKQDA